MAIKKLTVFLVPEGTNSVKQFRLPWFLPLFFALFFLSFSALFIWMINDYLAIRVQMPRLAQLEKENQLKEEQFILMAKRIDQVSQRMGELKEFDRKIKAMVNLETGEDNARMRGVGGSDLTLSDPAHTVAKAHKELVQAMHRSLDNLDVEVALGEQDKTELHKFLEKQKTLLASTPSIWPTRGWVTSRFGYRTSPFTSKREFHKGVDIAARRNAPIVTPADGIASNIEWHSGYGRVLTIKHGYGIITRYAHLQKALIKRGQYVKRGETVALVGRSGRTTGSHLHYEVHLNGVPINPLRYILN
ncbi:MAG: M23 family metallopeptidase [Deltaproteobacteria bacterium]|nr:M23 family metallopeptidase [Deltaproteobacteria bacterium]